jgi:integrase
MKLTDAKIKNLPIKDVAYNVKCANTQGLSIKVTPSARKTFIVDGRIKGSRTRRITLGTYPSISTDEAREKAQALIGMMQRGEDPKELKREQNSVKAMQAKTLATIFEEFLSMRTLKPTTIRDYRGTLKTVFAAWLNRPIKGITRKDVSDHFAVTKDTRGQPTAAKAFRILSSIMNFAKADDVGGVRLLTENPVDVLKEKKIDRRVRPRERYLKDTEIDRLMHFDFVERNHYPNPTHGVTDQGMNYVMLLLFTGMRKSEVANLKWEDVDFEKKTLVARNTKNNTDHYVPMSKMIQWKLKAQKKVSDLKRSEWVFPRRVGIGPMTEPKSQLARICKATGLQFRLHDLRRTFATHAMSAGVSYELIQKALNHKSGSVTSNYIINNVDMMRPVFDTIFLAFSKMYLDIEEYEELVDPGSGQPIGKDADEPDCEQNKIEPIHSWPSQRTS